MPYAVREVFWCVLTIESRVVSSKFLYQDGNYSKEAITYHGSQRPVITPKTVSTKSEERSLPS